MLLADVVATSTEVASTRSRKAKTAAFAELFARVTDSSAEEIETVTSYLAGSLRQRRTGLGWRSMQSLPAPAAEPSLTVLEVHEAFERIAALSGSGSQGARAAATAELFGRATAEEQPWLRGIVTGEVRQGALDSLVQEGLAAAGGVPLAAVRRAAMMAGSTVAVATAALTGGEEALAEFVLEVGRPVLPMLASSATTVEAAMDKAGGGDGRAIDTKLDGIRIQVHRRGDDVIVATRSLEDITARLPEVVAVARALPASDFVLDGEVLALDDQGRPRPFQETASRTAMSEGVHLTPYFFDLLHLDGRDLVDSPGSERLEALAGLVPEEHLVPRLVTVRRRRGRGVRLAGARPRPRGRGGQEPRRALRRRPPRLRLGEGEAGAHPRPGRARRRVGLRPPPRLALQHPPRRPRRQKRRVLRHARQDLQGHDRRDARLADRAVHRARPRPGRPSTTTTSSSVRPEQVVEIAFDGLQRSTRYPGGMALRFARVVRYRDDKTPDQADTIETVRELFGR